jgi:glycosyltransferase 2 family protein
MIWVKRGITLLAFAIVLYLFWPLIGEMRKSANLIREAQWGWIIVALMLQFASYANLTGLNLLLLRPFEGKINFPRMMAVLTSLAFIEVAIPSAGVSGVVLRARLLGKHGYTLEASMFTVFLEAIYISSVMIIVAIAGVWYLVQYGNVRPFQWVLLIGLTLIAITAGLLAYWTGRDRERAKRWALKAGYVWNWILQKVNRPPISMDETINRVDVFFNGLEQLGKTPRWPFIATSFGRVLLDVATLGACFKAFHFSIPTGILLTGFGLTLTLSGLASIPGGFGLADASLAVIFARLGAPGAVAVAAALTYRLIAYWLIRFIGLINWVIMEAKS